MTRGRVVTYGVFSLDVTAAVLVYLNIETVVMLLYPTNPPGIELYYHALFWWKNKSSSSRQSKTDTKLLIRWLQLFEGWIALST